MLKKSPALSLSPSAFLSSHLQYQHSRPTTTNNSIIITLQKERSLLRLRTTMSILLISTNNIIFIVNPRRKCTPKTIQSPLKESPPPRLLLGWLQPTWCVVAVDVVVAPMSRRSRSRAPCVDVPSPRRATSDDTWPNVPAPSTTRVHSPSARVSFSVRTSWPCTLNDSTNHRTWVPRQRLLPLQMPTPLRPWSVSGAAFSKFEFGVFWVRILNLGPDF